MGYKKVKKLAYKNLNKEARLVDKPTVFMIVLIYKALLVKIAVVTINHIGGFSYCVCKLLL